MLNVNSLIGFGVGGSGYEIKILVNTANFSLTSALTAVGWGGGPAEVRVIVAPGVVVYGTAGNPGFTTSGVPYGSVINLVNSGIITGAGGMGGDATPVTYGGPGGFGGVGSTGLITTVPMTIDNSAGVIAGGGGGGGAGGTSKAGDVYSTGGGAGGGGSGFGAGGLASTVHYLGGTPQPGAVGGLLTGGAGGAGDFPGAAGGGWPGTGIGGTGANRVDDPSSLLGVGGNPGNCTSGSSFITWIATGTRYGTLA